ncbi:hypothetical protein G7A72_10635 [Flavobacterium sp. Sr18]|uniref:hypothetical protein n=1 Tax=Flavobacterium sp. Sr18 TaxID=935222 RepID=UPI0013E43984|nr:hypothetical protein [Flavobacterium sp. Sr18]QIH39237.1 hypothetical protein G7A72_10635 [Flavobacterium sp. Sr18]
MKTEHNQDIITEIEILKNIINSNTDDNKVIETYTKLGEIGEKFELNEITNFLIEKYITEKNEDVKKSIHSSIRKQRKNENTKVKPLLLILQKYKKSNIIESVLELLHNSKNSEIENALINVLENNHSDWIYKRVNACLHTSGTRKSIPYLIKKINHKSNDVAQSSLITVIRLSDKRESELFINELANGKIKDVAMEGICLHSDIEGVDIVMERLKKKTSRKRETDCSTYFYVGNENETTIGLKYLNKFKDERKDIITFFTFLLDKRIEKLFDYEIEILKELLKTPSTKITLEKRI